MSNRKKIYIIGPTFGFERIVPRYGYDAYTDATYNDKVDVDIVAWMGGTDISTDLYGEKPIAETQRPDVRRDKREVALWHTFKDKPKLGICRGAQLLNVLNGGKLYQDVDAHEWGRHPIEDIYGQSVLSSSVHHQMMIPCPGAELIAWSKPIASYRSNANGTFDNTGTIGDPEILWVPHDKALLIQGHPEFGPDAFEKYSMELVDRLIWGQDLTGTKREQEFFNVSAA